MLLYCSLNLPLGQLKQDWKDIFEAQTHQPRRTWIWQNLTIPDLLVVYVDATDICNTAAFQLGQTAVGTTLATRSWNIKVGITYRALAVAQRLSARPVIRIQEGLGSNLCKNTFQLETSQAQLAWKMKKNVGKAENAKPSSVKAHGVIFSI